MCGIAGFVGNAVAPSLASSALKEFSTRISHRGPDHTGYMVWDGEAPFQIGDDVGQLLRDCSKVDIGLMHRRLSILDTSEHGHQPMVSRDGRYAIIQNGEIYNFIELRAELEALGHQFVSQSDTEVLLYALIEWGQKAFSKLIGMFAFCLIDRVDRTMMLARDFYGIKPLFYTKTGNGLVFGSEIKAIVSFPEIQLKPDLQSLRDYLSLGLVNHNERSFFAGIKSLLPGHCLTVSIDNPSDMKLSSFLAPRQNRLSARDISFEEASRELKERFMRSVELHMRSDVTYGALLSGGADSSAIVGAMREIGGDKLDLRTFTYAARGESCDEEHFADLMIDRVKANSTKILLSADNVSANIEKVMHFQDEPFGSSSIFAQFDVFKAARASGVTVLLDGQGADEILAGYTPYYTAALAGFIRKGEIGKAFNLIGYLKSNGRMSLANLLARSLVRLGPNFLGNAAHRKHAEGGVNSAINWHWFEKQNIASDYRLMGGTAPTLGEALNRDFDTLNLPGLLRYEDRNSMAHSIESRVPFLSPDFVSFAQTLPEEFLISPSGEDKAIFRHAMRGLVPNEILDRKDKIGFQTPEQSWFGELKRWVGQQIESDSFRMLPFIDNVEALKVWDTYCQIGGPFPRAIWRWINVAHWVRSHKLDF